MRTKSHLAFALAMVLLSCAPKESVRPEEFAPRPEIAVSEAVLLNSIAFNGIKTVKSEVRIRAERAGEGLGTLDGVFAFSAEGRMGIRMFGPLGITAMEVTINAGLMQIYIPSKDIAYEGEMPGGAGLKLAPDGESKNAVIEELDAGYALYMLDAGHIPARPQRAYTFDKNTLLNTSVVFFKDGLPAISVDFGDYQRVSPLPEAVSMAHGIPFRVVPMSINITFPQGNSMEIRLKNPALDEPVPDAFFALRPHDGLDVKPLGALFKKPDMHPAP